MVACPRLAQEGCELARRAFAALPPPSAAWDEPMLERRLLETDTGDLGCPLIRLSEW